jgi:GTPase SAR1 family protein
MVMGPAGCGKSTYCPTTVQHPVDNKRMVEVRNLDPVAEYFDYQPLVDIGGRGGGARGGAVGRGTALQV